MLAGRQSVSDPQPRHSSASVGPIDLVAYWRPRFNVYLRIGSRTMFLREPADQVQSCESEETPAMEITDEMVLRAARMLRWCGWDKAEDYPHDYMDQTV